MLQLKNAYSYLTLKLKYREKNTNIRTQTMFLTWNFIGKYTWKLNLRTQGWFYWEKTCSYMLCVGQREKINCAALNYSDHYNNEVHYKLQIYIRLG